MQPQAGQHHTEQGITLDARIEEAIATLIEVNARVSDDLKSKCKMERGDHTMIVVRMMNLPPGIRDYRFMKQLLYSHRYMWSSCQCLMMSLSVPVSQATV